MSHAIDRLAENFLMKANQAWTSSAVVKQLNHQDTHLPISQSLPTCPYCVSIDLSCCKLSYKLDNFPIISSHLVFAYFEGISCNIKIITPQFGNQHHKIGLSQCNAKSTLQCLSYYGKLRHITYTTPLTPLYQSTSGKTN